MIRFFKKKTAERKAMEELVKNLTQLLSMISGTLEEATEMEQAQPSLDMLAGLADKGCLDARYMLALTLLDERKPWHDAGKGKDMLEQAAERGYADAQFDLALMCYERVTQDPVTGHYWMVRAADQGFVAAQRFLERLKS